MNLADIKVGDLVELDCPQLLKSCRQESTITGKVQEVFDALYPDGSEGNLEIIIVSNTLWIKYIPRIDFGKITVIARKAD